MPVCFGKNKYTIIDSQQLQEMAVFKYQCYQKGANITMLFKDLMSTAPLQTHELIIGHMKLKW